MIAYDTIYPSRLYSEELHRCATEWLNGDDLLLKLLILISFRERNGPTNLMKEIVNLLLSPMKAISNEAQRVVENSFDKHPDLPMLMEAEIDLLPHKTPIDIVANLSQEFKNIAAQLDLPMLIQRTILSPTLANCILLGLRLFQVDGARSKEGLILWGAEYKSEPFKREDIEQIRKITLIAAGVSNT